MAEHALIAYLSLSGTGFGNGGEFGSFQHLADELAEAIEEAGVGEFDGDEFGEGACVFYMYGPNADALFAAVEPILRKSPLAANGRVVKRYGTADDASVKEISILL